MMVTLIKSVSAGQAAARVDDVMLPAAILLPSAVVFA